MSQLFPCTYELTAQCFSNFRVHDTRLQIDNHSDHHILNYIAGGREVYSQSRSRPGRHGKAGAGGAATTSGTAAAAALRRPHRQPEAAERPPQESPHVVRETVFSSEIYEQTTSKAAAETDIVDCGGGGDVNVTYADIMEGAVAESGLVVKKAGSDPDTVSLNSSSCHSSADLSSLCGGAGSKNVIGGVTIAEYEGSPRRYRPRKSETTEGAAKKSTGARRRTAPAGSPKVPGFPQRVIPKEAPVTVSSPPSSPSSSSSSVTQKRKQQTEEVPSEVAAAAVPSSSEVLVKFDEALQEKGGEGVEPEEDHIAARRVPPTTQASKDGGYDYQYEFSETRKVLNEFFPAKDVKSSESKIVAAPEDNFMDLNYTLTRRSANNYGPPRQNGGAGFANLPNPPDPPSTVESSDLLQLHHPQVGLSPLDHQPPPSALVGKAAASSSSDVTISTASSVATTGTGRSNGTDTGYATLNSPDSVRHNAPSIHQPQQQQHTQKPPPFKQAPQRGTNHVEFSQVAPVEPVQAVQAPGNRLMTQAVASAAASTTTVDGSGRNFTLSPETTDCDSADLESEVSMNEGSFHSSGPRVHTAMPILEDGLSSGHASDLEEDVVYSR